MHGSGSDHHQHEPGEAGGVATEVAPGQDDRARGDRAERQLRSFVREALGATQASRTAKAKARRRVRKGRK